ncbi:hypothetical protein [[Scytonema hofmanni] UTEX B 1581]|nr:hypothetical protein [[Scytonema hofmanni] UTEX B 1581]
MFTFYAISGIREILNDLISTLGAKSGGDLVDDSDPKLLKFLQQLHNR